MICIAYVQRVGFEHHVGAVLGSPLLAHPLGTLSAASTRDSAVQVSRGGRLTRCAVRPNHPSMTREGRELNSYPQSMVSGSSSVVMIGIAPVQ